MTFRVPGLPAPLVPADVDLRDVPIPRHSFAVMLARARSIPVAEARRLVDQISDGMERSRSHRGGSTGGAHEPA